MPRAIDRRNFQVVHDPNRGGADFDVASLATHEAERLAKAIRAAMEAFLEGVMLALKELLHIDIGDREGFAWSLFQLLEQALKDMVSNWRSFAAGYVGLGNIGAHPLELLLQPLFNSPESIEGNGIWFYDATVFYEDATGSATTTIGAPANVPHQLASDPEVLVSTNQTIRARAAVRWRGVTVSNPSANAVVLVIGFYDDNGDELASHAIAAITNPATDSEFVELTAVHRIDEVFDTFSARLSVIITDNVTAGQFWVSKSSLKAIGILLPEFVTDLPETMRDLLELLTSLGLGRPDIGAIEERFRNIFADGFFDGGFLRNAVPLPSIPRLPANWIDRGRFDRDRIPELPADWIRGGIFDQGLIPGLPADRINSGMFDLGRIPDLPADRINSGIFDIDRVPTGQLGRHNIRDLDGVYGAMQTAVGSGATMMRSNPANVDLPANRGAQLLPTNFFDGDAVPPSADIQRTLSNATFRVSIEGWYVLQLCYKVNPALSAVWNICPVIFKNGHVEQYGNDSLSYTAVSIGVTTRFIWGSFTLPLLAGDYVQAGFDAANNTGLISNVLTGQDGRTCYFSITMTNTGPE